jgi:hypothetical protein
MIIEEQKNKYNKIYTDLIFASDDLTKILDKEELSKRSFLVKLETLKEYINFLDSLEKNKNKSFFKKIFINDNIESKISKFLTKDKISDLEKLSRCSECMCINCVNKCPMNMCYNCREKESVKGCDKINTTFTTSNETVTLYNKNEPILFNVKGYLIEKDEMGNFKRYVYLIDDKNYDNQHLLRYSKFKGEESYNSVITDDSQDELIRLNDKFIEMGLRV